MVLEIKLGIASHMQSKCIIFVGLLFGDHKLQCIIPGLALEIIPGGIRGTRIRLRDQTQVSHVQDKHPTCCIIALAPQHLILSGTFMLARLSDGCLSKILLAFLQSSFPRFDCN